MCVCVCVCVCAANSPAPSSSCRKTWDSNEIDEERFALGKTESLSEMAYGSTMICVHSTVFDFTF